VLNDQLMKKGGGGKSEDFHTPEKKSEKEKRKGKKEVNLSQKQQLFLLKERDETIGGRKRGKGGEKG